MRRYVAVRIIGVAAALLTPSSARTQQQLDDEAMAKEALAACDSGQIRKGIEILGALWAQTLDSTYVYNQGRCYQKNAMTKEAISRFNEFLRVARDRPPEDPSLIERARMYIKELEAELSANEPRQAASKATVAAPNPVAPSPRVVEPSLGQPTSQGVSIERIPEQSTANQSRRVIGYVLGAGGLVAVGVGALLVVTGANSAGEARDRFTAARTGDAWDKAKADFGVARDRNRIGWGLAGMGAALTVGGAALVATRTKHKQSVSLMVAPLIAPQFAGLGLESSW